MFDGQNKRADGVAL